MPKLYYKSFGTPPKKSSKNISNNPQKIKHKKIHNPKHPTKNMIFVSIQYCKAKLGFNSCFIVFLVVLACFSEYCFLNRLPENNILAALPVTEAREA